MPNTPELEESVVHDYVHTNKSTPQIAADHRISERDVTRIRHAHGIPTRRSRARELPETMREVDRLTKQLMAAAPPAATVDVGRNTRGAAEHIAPDTANPTPPALDGPAPSIVPPLSGEAEHDLHALIARVIRLVERELAAEEVTRADLGLHPRTSTELERCARIVASMTRSLRDLLRLHAALAPEQSPLNHDLPEDADDTRDELARRIEALLASWEAEASADGAA